MLKIFIGILIAVGHGVLAAELPKPLADDDFRLVRKEEAALGQLLFYDPLLSGNKEVACATCHTLSLGRAMDFHYHLGMAVRVLA